MTNEKKELPKLEKSTRIKDRELEDLKDKAARLAALEKELEAAGAREQETKDRCLRLAAEYDNYRKRTEKEKQDIYRYGSERLISQLIPFDDIFERVLGSIEKDSAQGRSVHQGLEMLRKEFLAILGSLGVRKIETLGRKFDPHLHEAVGAVEIAGRGEDEIVEEELCGYMLHDKVLRPASVKVAKAPASEEKDAAHESGNTGQD